MDHVTALHKAWGREVKLHRLGQGLSLRGLAERAGIRHTMVKKVEDGDVDTSTAVKLKIAVALGVRPVALFSLDAADRPEKEARETVVA